jgi:hypothetical protein
MEPTPKRWTQGPTAAAIRDLKAFHEDELRFWRRAEVGDFARRQAQKHANYLSLLRWLERNLEEG